MDAIETQTIFVAGWNIPGYMPESTPVAFSTLADAILYLDDELRHIDDYAENDAIAIDAGSARNYFASAIGSSDYSVGNYVYWIQETPIDYKIALAIFSEQVQTMDCIDSISGNSAYGSDSHVKSYATGEEYRTSFHLQVPTDTPMEYAYNGNGSICHDPIGEPIGKYCILEIREYRTPCPDDDRCGEDGECESYCIQEPTSWHWEYHELDTEFLQSVNCP